MVKGIILAGGSGSRLHPCTKVTNKHLLPVYDKPMIYYPLKLLADAGIKDILIISGPGHAGHFLNLLGSGREFGVDLSFDIQEEAGGIAQALSIGKNFVGNDKCAVVLGDNIFEDNIKEFVENFEKQGEGARIFLKEVSMEEAKRFGCALTEGDKVTYVEEKPKEPKSNLAITGLYMFDSKVFDFISGLKPSARGELEIVDALNYYVQQGKCKYDMLKGFWSDAGTFESLHKASSFLRSKSESVGEEKKQLTEEVRKFQNNLEIIKRKISDLIVL